MTCESEGITTPGASAADTTAGLRLAHSPPMSLPSPPTTALREDWRVVVALVSAGHFLSHFYFLTLPPLLPLLQAEFGLSNTELGLIISLFALGGLLQAPVGNLVDRVGAKWVFVAGMAVTGGGIALIGVGPTYPAILALAVIPGLGQSAFHPSDYSLIDSVTASDVQGRAFSIHTFSGFAGFAAAPLVVGTLGAMVGWRGALFAVGAVGLGYAAFSVVALAPVYQRGGGDGDQDDGSSTGGLRSVLAVLGRPGIMVMAGFFLLLAFASKGIQTFTAVLVGSTFGLPTAVGNTLLTAFFAAGAVGVLVGGVLADRYPPARIIVATLAVGAVVLLATVTGLLPATAASLAALFAVVGFFTTLVTPARDRLVSDLADAGSMGRSFGVVFTGATIGSLVGPVFLGAVGDLAAIDTAFVIVGVAYLLGGALVLVVRRVGPAVPGPSPADD